MTTYPTSVANAAFCDDLAAYGIVIGDLAVLDPATATKDGYQSAADEVSSEHATTWSTARRT